MSEGAGTARPHLSRMSGARNPWLQLQQRHRVLVATSLLFQDRGGVIRLAIIEKPGAARRARMLCGIFFAISLQSSLSLARAGQRGVAGVAAGCWVVGGATAGAAKAGRAAAGAAAGRTRGSQRPFTMRIFRALHLRTAARTAEFRTQMPSISCRPRPHPWRT